MKNKKETFWGSIFKRHTMDVSMVNNHFSEDRFVSLYNLEYKLFLNALFKDNVKEILKQSDQLISKFIGNHALDAIQAIDGIHRWLDGMSQDENIYNYNEKTIIIREKTHEIFANKIESLIKYNRLYGECKVDFKISEAVFLKNSINFYLEEFIKK